MIVPQTVDGVPIIAIYCPAGDARPYTAPEKLEKNAEHHYYVRTNSETVEAKNDLPRQLNDVSSRTPFDARACIAAHVDDISPALLHHHLQMVKSRLIEERLDTPSLLSRMGLLKGSNGHRHPLNVALLFFSYAPSLWFHGAHIEVTHMPNGPAGDEFVEQNIDGPLPLQLREALQYLKNFLPTKVIKLPDRAESIRIEAYPFGAVEEALVNAVHHRGYDVPDPIKVEILPNAIRIVSYPGPVPGLSEEDLQTDSRSPQPARNRRIAEFLKSLGLAEARASGLPRIRREMLSNGSPPAVFRFDQARTWFEVFLPIHPAFITSPITLPSQPLRIGRPARASEVIGRSKLIETILRNLETQSILVVGPPGRGKSSLLNALQAKISTEKCFLLDLNGINFQGFTSAVITWADEHLSLNKELEDSLQIMAKQGITLLLDNLDSFGVSELDHNETLNLLSNYLQKIPGLRVIACIENINGLADRNFWIQSCRLLPLTPLHYIDTVELTQRLLRGTGHFNADILATTIANISAGIPDIIVKLVARIYADGTENVQNIFDALFGDIGDPTGLQRRDAQLLAFPALTLRFLWDITSTPEGRSRSDLVAQMVTNGWTRTAVLATLRSLEIDGFLVEVDGLIRLEHPILKESLQNSF